MRSLLALAALGALVAVSDRASAQDVVDGVVAVVGERPLMWSDVLFEAEIRSVEASGGREINLRPTQADPEVMEVLVERALILQEMGAEFLAPEEAVNRRLERFLDRFERVEDLTRWLGRWKISTRELRAHFAEGLRVSSYAERRLTSAVRLSDGEVYEAYAEDPRRWGGTPYDEVSGVIRNELWAKRLDEQRQRWLDGIREKRGVRYTDLGQGLLGAAP